jgi:hypothetical protein
MEARTCHRGTTGDEDTINSSEVKIMQLLDNYRCLLSIYYIRMVII